MMSPVTATGHIHEALEPLGGAASWVLEVAGCPDFLDVWFFINM
jgi:hypothetical protein